MKQSDGIRAAADTCDQNVRQPAFLFDDLFACFAPNDTLKIPDHQRVWVWTECAAEQIVSVADVRHPITECFVDRVFERARAGVYFANFRAEQLHAKNIQL